MKQYDITVGREDLRWVGIDGNEKTSRGKYDCIFRSSVTDEAQKLIEANGFEGSYMRHLSTGHAETQWVNLAMLSLAERYDSIVGVTLEGLASDRIAQSIIGFPAGKILYEVLEDPTVFKISTDAGIEVPTFNDDSASVNTWEGRLFGGMKFVPNKEDKSPNQQAERIKRQVYLELQPEFVAALGSVNMQYGSFRMDDYRAMAQRAKEEGLPHYNPGLVDRICDLLGI